MKHIDVMQVTYIKQIRKTRYNVPSVPASVANSPLLKVPLASSGLTSFRLGMYKGMVGVRWISQGEGI